MKDYFLLLLLCCSFSLFGIEEKKQILFIINPLAHEIKDLDIQKMIEKNLDLKRFDYAVVYTERAGHATELAREAFKKGTDIIAAVGGDGTVQEVGKALIHTKATLAIVPVGSGNGLARHLKIPVGFAQGVRALNRAHPITIDTATINDHVFLGVAGIGFDALIAHQFATFGKRGFLSYCQVALKEFARYQPELYRITIDGKSITRKAFVLTFANSSQYGNDFMIAPQARVQDNMLDLVIIDDIPAHAILETIYRLRQGKLKHFSHYETYRFKELTIQHPDIQAHVDGEPIRFKDSLKVKILPSSLRVLAVF